MCDKEPYNSESEARDAARGMGRHHNISMEHYFCWQCRFWHVRTRGKKPKGKRNNNKYPFRYEPQKKNIQNFKKKKR